MERGDKPDNVPNTLDTVIYIVAILKPLLEITRSRELRTLGYFIEMAVLHASEVEMRLRKRSPGQPEIPPVPDGVR
jgi:hypothetical protein